MIRLEHTFKLVLPFALLFSSIGVAGEALTQWRLLRYGLLSGPSYVSLVLGRCSP
jgi:hypothetical protein